jgi:mannosyltransferase
MNGLRQEGRLLATFAGEPTSALERGVLLGLLVVAAGLRLNELGIGLWYDEIETLVRYARLPLVDVVTTFDSQNQHLLYSLLSSVTVGLFGESAWALRLPAVMFGILSLAALWWFARKVTGNREALLATALLTFSYHHVWFSQNARGYTALLFWSLLGSGWFVSLLRREREGWRDPLLYGLCMALAAYTHVTAVLVVVAHAAVLLLLWWRAGAAGRGAATPAAHGIFLSAGFTILFYAPVLPQLFTTLTAPSPHNVETVWKDPFWLAMETLRGLANSLPGGWFALAGAMLVGGSGLLSYARQSLTILALFLLPAILTGALVLVLGHNLWPRFFFFSAGFAALIGVRGIFALVRSVRIPRAGQVATAAACLVIAGSAVTLRRAWQPKQDFLGAAEFIRASQGSNDAVVVVDLTEYPYRNYLHKSWQPVEDVAGLMEIERGHSRTWVLYTFPIRLAAAHPDIWSRLQDTYSRAAIFPGTIGDGAIVVMVTPSDSTRTREPA